MRSYLGLHLSTVHTHVFPAQINVRAHSCALNPIHQFLVRVRKDPTVGFFAALEWKDTFVGWSKGAHQMGQPSHVAETMQEGTHEK